MTERCADCHLMTERYAALAQGRWRWAWCERCGHAHLTRTTVGCPMCPPVLKEKPVKGYGHARQKGEGD